ncbi:MAG: hypothetical protein ACK50J_29670 [Planctomyces sp.]
MAASEVASFCDWLAERAQGVAPRFSVGETMPPNYSAVERREMVACVRERWLMAVANYGVIQLRNAAFANRN